MEPDTEKPKSITFYCRIYITEDGPKIAHSGSSGNLNHEGAYPWYGKEFTITVNE